MNARLVNTVADAICRSMENGKKTPAGWAMDLESAQLLQSPETAAACDQVREMYRSAERDVAQLQRRIVDLEQQLEALRAQGRVLRGSADGITKLIAPVQALRDEDPFLLHHDYAVPRDLPETGGAR